MALLFGKGIDNNFAYADFLTNKGCIVKNGAWFTIKMNGTETKVNGMSRVIEWVNENKEDVRSYINSQGGYKLLMNAEQSIDINGGDNMDEDVYAESMIDGEFKESEDEKVESDE